MMDERMAMIGLSVVPKVTARIGKQLLEHFGSAVAICHASEEELHAVEGVPRSVAGAVLSAQSTVAQRAAQMIARTQELNARVIAQPDAITDDVMATLLEHVRILEGSGAHPTQDWETIQERGRVQETVKTCVLQVSKVLIQEGRGQALEPHLPRLLDLVPTSQEVVALPVHGHQQYAVNIPLAPDTAAWSRVVVRDAVPPGQSEAVEATHEIWTRVIDEVGRLHTYTADMAPVHMPATVADAAERLSTESFAPRPELDPAGSERR